MRTGVCLKDIAARAGVSTTLVSYVLNNQKVDRINKLTAQKIRDTAKLLNYSGNQLARGLKTNKTYTIGLIVSDISNPFSASLARIIEDEAEKHQYTTIFGSSDEDINKFEKLVHTMINRKVDGLIISPPSESESIINHLLQQRIPFVLLDRYFPAIKTSYVALDNYDASFNAVNHLISTGRKRIGMITYDSDLFHLQERKRGYISALEKSNLGFEKKWLKLVGIGNDRPGIEKAVRELLSSDPRIDAVLFGSNRIATCSLKLINSLSVKVPDDLAVICFDHTEMLDLFYSPVTYVEQPLEEIGKLAIKNLLESIKDPSVMTATIVKAKLIVQQSTKV
jgi:LacI family transcriptional regulator